VADVDSNRASRTHASACPSGPIQRDLCRRRPSAQRHRQRPPITGHGSAESTRRWRASPYTGNLDFNGADTLTVATSDVDRQSTPYNDRESPSIAVKTTPEINLKYRAGRRP